MLSHPLPVVALVSFYLTNKLIGRRILSTRRTFTPEDQSLVETIEYYSRFREIILKAGVDSYVLLTRLPRP